jgi:hypothetical protein
MVKVTGPMHSDGAAGQFAKAMVFAGWKGVQYARKYVIPANPQTEGQGDQRIIMGGVGRACGKVSVLGGFNVKLALKNLPPAGQSKQSYLVKYIIDHYLATITAYETELAELTGATAYTAWQTGATALGITNFDLAYATTAAFDRGLGLRLLYKTQQALGFTGAVYTVTLAAMTGADIDAFVAVL